MVRCTTCFLACKTFPLHCTLAVIVGAVKNGSQKSHSTLAGEWLPRYLLQWPFQLHQVFSHVQRRLCRGTGTGQTFLSRPTSKSIQDFTLSLISRRWGIQDLYMRIFPWDLSGVSIDSKIVLFEIKRSMITLFASWDIFLMRFTAGDTRGRI